MLPVQNRTADALATTTARRMTRAAALLVLAGSLAACDLVPQGGYRKIDYRARKHAIQITNPPPPPVVAGMGGGSSAAAVPKLAAGAPPGVTQAMVDEGAKLFPNPCAACHGPAGAGTAAAPSLADAEWLNISGSYDEIVHTIHTGVPNPKAHAAGMPPLGGGTFNDEQVKQLAAYIFALSHSGS